MLHRIEARGIDAMSLTSGAWKTVQEPVVKSCSRVPMASTTSASAASALAEDGADDADRADIHGMLMAQHPAAGDGLGHRDAVLGSAKAARRSPAPA